MDCALTVVEKDGRSLCRLLQIWEVLCGLRRHRFEDASRFRDSVIPPNTPTTGTRKESVFP